MTPVPFLTWMVLQVLGMFTYLLPSGNILISDRQMSLWVLGRKEPNSIEARTRSISNLENWPNPSNHVLNFSANEMGMYYEIFKTQGQRVIADRTVQLNNVLDISKFAPGFYSILLSKDGLLKASNRFVKN